MSISNRQETKRFPLKIKSITTDMKPIEFNHNSELPKEVLIPYKPKPKRMAREELTLRTYLKHNNCSEEHIEAEVLRFLDCSICNKILASHPEPQQEKQTAELNYMQMRDLTDEEWLKLPKEEILQLYKNCYSMLNQQISYSNNHVQYASQSQSSVLPSEESCPDCGGDGIETCTNPDHGLICALSSHDIGRIGCPLCGHRDDHKIIGSECPACNGSGKIKSQLKQGYPKEFVEWLKSNDTPQELIHEWMNTDKSCDELFQFWQTEVNGR